MELHEIGALLKRERERQGFTVDEVMERTKISRRIILGIEEGDESKLPHPVYAKGFVRSYAQTLGLNVDEISCAFAEIYGPAEEECETEQVQEAEPRQYRGALFAVLGGTVLVVALMIFYFLSTGEDSVEPTVPSGETVVAPYDQEMRDFAGENRNEPSPDVIPEPAPAEDMEEPVLPQEEFPEIFSDEPSDMPENGSEELLEGSTAGEQETMPGLKTLSIQAVESCWLVASIDGKRQEIYLRPGERVTLEFSSLLEVRFGNAGGVELTFNGKPYPFEAESGEVRTLTFPPARQ
ncbi:MAG: helix-turn-helix domain-containing protein [Desulfovibrionales bacterium]